MVDVFDPYMAPMPPMGVPMPQQVDRSEFIKAINNQQLVEDTFYILQGYEKRNGKWVLNPNLKHFAINETGATAFTNFLRMSCSTATSMGDYTEDQIGRIMYSIAETLWDMCNTNMKEFDIKDGGHSKYIVDVCFNNAYSVWSHGKQGGWQTMFGKIMKEQNAQVYNSAPSGKKNFLQKMFG